MKTKTITKAKTEKTLTTTADVLAKVPTALVVPLRVLANAQESIVCGFRMSMLTMGDVGEVMTGTGLGSDFIHLKWGEHQAVVRGSELLRAFVQQVAPKDAERFPDHVKAAPL